MHEWKEGERQGDRIMPLTFLVAKQSAMASSAGIEPSEIPKIDWLARRLSFSTLPKAMVSLKDRKGIMSPTSTYFKCFMTWSAMASVSPM